MSFELEEPFLYTWNRRLRHLHGISLRNLNIAPPIARNRGRTITDDDYNLITPTKLLAQDERKILHHARSFDNISEAGLDTSPTPLAKSATTYDKSSNKSKRPGGRNLRRRSTLHWATSDPKLRQLKLEAVEENRLVDTWFSIHHASASEPLYVSEVMEKAMNPSFSFFDLNPSMATIHRSDEFGLKVWAKCHFAEGYRLLLDMEVNMRSLQFIGKTMEHFHHPLPENCVLVHLSDGIYTNFTDLPSEDSSQPGLTEAMRSLLPAQISSFDVLMQLTNLDDCIQDALQIRARLESDIANLLHKSQANSSALSDLTKQKEVCASVKSSVMMEGRRIDQTLRTVANLKTTHIDRRRLMEESTRQQKNSQVELTALESSAIKTRKQLENVADSTDGQRRRICNTLSQIFPIEPVKNKTLQFSIRGIQLPNSVYDDTNSDQIAAALSYTAQVVHQLSLYLSVPLPYEIRVNGTNASIFDGISASLPQRKFPLFPTSVTYKFEYGVFLLNKNIEFLMNRCGIRVLDVRHTLPNLKYLLYLLTSGTGELPARKAGGIRGLVGGRASPSISRRGSDESVLSQPDRVENNLISRISGIGSEMGREKMANASESPYLATHAKGLPYRRSMLRETS